MVVFRRKPIDRIELSIEQLERRASDLLAREQDASREVASLEQADPRGRVRALRVRRRLRRRRALLERLSGRRRALIDGEIRSIMFALQEQSQRTRDELDRELERLAPVQEQWERLRTAFDTLEATLGRPAFGALANHWRGQLQIPEFPLAQRSGYAKPFPRHALLF